MSKENLEKLNDKLLQHFKETGVENAYYYEPLFEYYWQLGEKIGLCNLESYDKSMTGIHKVTANLILDYWYNSQTIQKSLKMFQAITWKLENERDITEDIIKSFDNTDWEKAIEDMGSGLYFNLRLTTGNQVQEDKKGIEDFYKDPFYAEYFREFVNAAELDMLIITGETGVKTINKIYPELNLVWGDEMEAKVYDNVLFCPAPHPSRESYKKMADDLNYFFDLFFKRTEK